MHKNTLVKKITFIECPVPSVQALHQTRRFFETLFGWSYNDWGDDYVDTSDSGVGTGLNADAQRKPMAPLPVIHTHDLEAMQAKIKTSHGEITRPIFAFPGGRRFHFRDPAGNEWAVWSDRPEREGSDQG